MISIRHLSPKDSLSLSRLHLQNLNTFFVGKPGLQLLSLYYKVIALGRGSCGFVAEQDGRIVGFVCGIWDPKKVRSTLLKKYFFLLIFWAFIQIMVKPVLLKSFLGRFERVPSNSTNEEFELRPIVVVSEARGTGLSLQLLRNLLNSAQEQGFPQIFLVTEENNTSANRFYQRSGFQLKDKANRNGIKYNRYEISTF